VGTDAEIVVDEAYTVGSLRFQAAANLMTDGLASVIVRSRLFDVEIRLHLSLL